MLSARDRSVGARLWQQILQSDQPWLRRTAERSLLQLQALDQIDELQGLVRQDRLPAGRRVTWTDLVRRGILPGVPVDPTGAPYRSIPTPARVTISPASSLNPMPDLPRSLR